jgi:hypothetical protein
MTWQLLKSLFKSVSEMGRSVTRAQLPHALCWNVHMKQIRHCASRGSFMETLFRYPVRCRASCEDNNMLWLVQSAIHCGAISLPRQTYVIGRNHHQRGRAIKPCPSRLLTICFKPAHAKCDGHLNNLFSITVHTDTLTWRLSKATH